MNGSTTTRNPRYSDGSAGEPMTATALRSKLKEGRSMDSGGNYREVSTRRTFRLVCARCRHNGCREGSQRIRKLGQTWTEYWASYFVHNTSDHQADCVCVLGAGGGGGTARKRRFLEHRVFIPTKRAYPEGNLALLIEFRKPETTSGYLKTWFQTRRMPAIDNIDSFHHSHTTRKFLLAEK